MERDWVFILTDPSKYYNIWTDLIASIVTDPTFSNYPFIPNMVSFLKINNQTTATRIKFSTTKSGGMNIFGGSEETITSELNTIDLKGFYLNPDTNPTSVYVSIVAK